MAVKIGSISISDAKIGTNSLSAIYVGSTKIWPESEPPVPPSYDKLLFILNNSNLTLKINIQGDTLYTLDAFSQIDEIFDTRIPIGIKSTNGEEFRCYINNVEIIDSPGHNISVDISDVEENSIIKCDYL